MITIHKKPISIRPDIIIAFGLTVITLAVYWQVRSYEFINLDDAYITENPYFQAGLTTESIKRAFTTTMQAGYWLPLTWLSHLTDLELYGNNSGQHHLTNLLFHILNVLLLFFVFKRMTGELWKSGFIAVLFAIHPLHIESVAWVAERKDVLSAFFWFLTMHAYCCYVKSPGTGRYLLIVISFILGLMSKPMLVTLPFVLILLDYWPLKRLQKSETSRLFFEKAPLFILAIIASIITFIAQQKAGAVNSLNVLPVHVRIENALVSYLTYLIKMIWPSDLAVLYPHPLVLPLWKVALSLAILTAISLFAIRTFKQHPYFIVGWLWYLGVLLPVSGLVQSGVQALADRFVYIPLIGIYIVIAWGFPAIMSQWRFRNVICAVTAAAAISMLIVTSWTQVRLWKDSITLYEHTLTVTSGNYLIHNHLGAAFREKINPAKAILHFKKAIQINPAYASAYNNLGAVLAEQGKFDDAILYYSESLEINPHYSPAHYNLAMALSKKGHIKEASKHYSEVLRINPHNAEAHNNYGIILAEQGNTDDAAWHFSEALRLKPDYSQAHHNMRLILFRKEKNSQF
ncbi:tetratricopeptide repeat protein [Desulfococcaceae bacterium HSG7]|nr:tetratricopeptide repeat protein [Desulfococcaceae bacterium HSG7]